MTIEFYRSKAQARRAAKQVNDFMKPYREKARTLRPVKVKITDGMAVGTYGIRGEGFNREPRKGDVGYVLGTSAAEVRDWKLEGVRVLG